MTISQTPLMQALDETPIDAFWLGYLRERLRGDIHEQLLAAFEASGLSRAELARKLGRRPEQITRWLSAPGNLEADTLSDLALALGMAPVIRLEPFAVQRSEPAAGAKTGKSAGRSRAARLDTEPAR